jgi:phosphoadenosine phosphosulfate reductase
MLIPRSQDAPQADFTTLTALADRLCWIGRHSDGQLAFSTSLGLEDQAILHAIAEAGINVDVFTLDTGRHFPETLDVIEASETRYGLKIRVVAPAAAELQSLVASDGINGFKRSVEARKNCCDVRKVRPLRQALTGAGGWITGLRRGQSGGRADVPFAAFDPDFLLMKFNPIADWTLSDLETYIATNDVPVNALHARGFPSIGCQPCTRAIEPGEDIRAGRWWWENLDGKECGLHNRPNAVKQPAEGAPA